jgi:hypothetical protein
LFCKYLTFLWYNTHLNVASPSLTKRILETTSPYHIVGLSSILSPPFSFTLGNESSLYDDDYDRYSYLYGRDDGLNRRNWADISQSALRRENQAKTTFATIKQEWESRQDLEPGSRHVIPLLNPSHHLVKKVWVRFHRQVKSLKTSHGDAGCWDLKNREATREERDTFRITRKSKILFVDAMYKFPKNQSSSKPSTLAMQPATTTTTAAAPAESKKRSSFLPSTSPAAGVLAVSSVSLPKKP